MSDLTPHSRDDLGLPSDCALPEPTAAEHICGCSPYLCPWCNPRRKLVAAVRDVSAVRDLPIWVWDELLPRSRDNVVSIAAERVKRRSGR